MLLRHLLLLFSSLCGLQQQCMSYHVVFYHNWGTKSHLIQISPLVEELLDRGHDVTSVLYDTLKVKHENYTGWSIWSRKAFC